MDHGKVRRLLIILALTCGCEGATIEGSPPLSGDAAPPDGSAGDATQFGSSDGGPDPCGGYSLCPQGTSCHARCVPTADPCQGVTCPSQKTCVAGQCVAGCFPVPCAGVVCPAGQSCSPSDGRCHGITACDASCPAGSTCDLVCVAPDRCAGVTCPSGQSCSSGRCISNP